MDGEEENGATYLRRRRRALRREREKDGMNVKVPSPSLVT